MIEKKYSVPNISCQHCVNTIQMELAELEQVRHAEADEKEKQVVVRFEESSDEQVILDLLKEIGYPAEQ